MPYCEGIFAGKGLVTYSFCIRYMLDGEKKLIQDAVRGKSSAFGDLYDHYQPMIYRFVAVKVGRREEAEDITHQVFLSAWQNIKTYEHRGHPFSSWLYQIARNQVIDHYRAKRNDTPLDAVDPEAFATMASAEFEMPTKLEMETVRRALATMKPDYQDVIIMRFIEDLPIRETADALDKSEGAIKLMQHRAIKELKRILKEWNSSTY
jgi:RNA polymerase sigma-70 factor (ECF subfamily)